MSPKVVGWEIYWQAFKSVVYLAGYTLCCWWIFWRNIQYAYYLNWSGSSDLALLCQITAAITWVVWTFGVGSIIVDGMRVIRELTWESI